MWEKKWDFFQGLIFVLQSLICGFGKIFSKKVVEKWIISWERLETCLCLKVSKRRNPYVAKFVCASKPFQRDIAGKRFKVLIFNACGKKVHRILAYHKPEVATFLWNDVKNDGYCGVTKTVRFFSKRIKMLDFTSWSDLLSSDSQHFEFWTNAFSESDLEKMLDLVFIVHQNFGTKFKIRKKVLTFCWIALVAA